MNINDALAKEYNRGLADGKASVEQKHGHWEDLNDCDEIYGDLYKCPFCGNVIVSYGIGGKPDNYCGNCGAKMDEVTEL